MNTQSVTVQTAIERGFKVITRPSKIIIFAGFALCGLSMLVNFSWSYLLIVLLGFVVSIIYAIAATTRWRIWAYEQVADIHQFQRSAEIAQLLAKQSYDHKAHFIGPRLQERLAEAQQRFEQDHLFIDDASIPNETPVYAKTMIGDSNKPGMVLSAKGIEFPGEAVLRWDEIDNERIAQVTYGTLSDRTESSGSARYDDLFRFETNGERREIPMAQMDISEWKLDLLCYIYRGRFNGGKLT